MWHGEKMRTVGQVTCPMCRAPWVDAAGKVGGAAAGARGAGEAATAMQCGAWEPALAFVCQLDSPSRPAAAGSGQPLNLAQYSAAHRGADLSIHALYGERARWIGGGKKRRRW